MKIKFEASMAMSTNTNGMTFDTLPVEVLYEILEYIDLRTILISFRNICSRFQSLIDNCYRYNVNFKSISKRDFDCLCQLIDPKQVQSLIISENEQTFDQINLFLNYFKLDNFLHLRTLSLSIVKEKQLHILLKSFHISSLQSFSLQIQNFDDRRKTTTAVIISSILEKANLYKLELEIHGGRFERLKWSNQCSIQDLKINNTISSDLFYDILQKLPHLKKFSLNSVKISNHNQSTSISSYQLKFLTFNKFDSNMNELERILRTFPILNHLKICAQGNYFDGYRWETLIDLHLPLLNKFEFFFTERYNSEQNLTDIDNISRLFRKPFWLEQKKWFVICELNTNTFQDITVYSIPRCTSVLSYQTKKISISTLDEMDNRNYFLMNNIRTLQLNFNKIDCSHRDNNPLFCRVKRLELDFEYRLPSNWLEFTVNLIDLKTVEQIKISSTFLRRSYRQLLVDIKQLFQRMSHVFSIDFDYDFYSRKSSLTANEIYSMIPMSIKHLAASIKNIYEIQNLLQQLPYLSSAHFMFEYDARWTQIKDWLCIYRPDSSVQADCLSCCVWLGKYTDELNEIKIGNKRMKLTEQNH